MRYHSQWLLSLVLLAIFFNVQGDSDSGSGSESNESGGKKHNYLTKPPPPTGSQAYGQPHYHYNHPVYMPNQWPPPPPPSYGGYYPPPMPYYYGYQLPAQQPVYGAYPYPYGGNYNQPPPPPPQPTKFQPESPNETPQGFPNIPGGISTINHSLKVNKEYKEDGHHIRPDGTPIELSTNI